ncbi:hypothetical protein [Mucilaginibacter myungsuensis]|uniref:Tetratricopeptide repeat protein n=1 Tax=Mucilaginibacter myungsuensis TaxID=649104 RepID=A0A929KZQ1_9SPHI|nr:hypothetical protein [Mucilaginibacter myungsuensis]MBE9663433.1 hypothetical protein [Mucilaginibacter myungsuensis]MDN3600171.1 hypothetical protein [Mucilaginibacter myungsuensis]
MEDYLNNRQKEILLRLLADPADTGSAYLSNLQEMVKIHPRSGLLRALYGRALNEPAPHVASGYFDSNALHKLLYRHDNLTPIANEQVAIQPDGKLFGQPLAMPADEPHFVTPEQLADIDTTIYADKPADIPAAFQSNDFAEPPAIPVEETLPADEHVADDRETPPPIPELEQIEQHDEAPALPPFEPAPWEITPTVTEQIGDDEQPLGRAPWEEDEDEEEAPVATEASSDQRYGWEEPINSLDQPEETAPGAAESQWQTEEVTAPVETNTIDDEMAAKLAYWASLEDEYDAEEQIPAPAQEVEQAPEPVNYAYQETPIHDDVYDEITSIEDIGLAQMAAEAAYEHQPIPAIEPIAEPVAEAIAETTEEAAPLAAEPAQPAKPADEERLIMGNIAATDFFRFDKAFGEPERPSTETTPPADQQFAAQAGEPENTHQDVSMYHDEKMPYTFMWWLDKTRREHGNLYQPYAKAPVNRPAAETPASKPTGDALQQQYVENIFHLTTEDLVAEDAKTVEFDMERKEDLIIQRFIEQDPHIHPPVGEKLNTENKAKRSSEDDLDMVTETLARIYADQMLFPKAIATYKKLMLKYPEKSRYFASRIENLEKRTN